MIGGRHIFENMQYDIKGSIRNALRIPGYRFIPYHVISMTILQVVPGFYSHKVGAKFLKLCNMISLDRLGILNGFQGLYPHHIISMTTLQVVPFFCSCRWALCY